MPEKINWSYVIQALNGPAMSEASTQEVEAYDKIDITVPGTGSSHTKTLSLPDTMSLLVISAVIPANPVSFVTYKGTPAIPGEPASGFKLDGPHIFIGEGATAFLGTATDLTFTNNTGADVEINVLVGRKTA